MDIPIKEVVDKFNEVEKLGEIPLYDDEKSKKISDDWEQARVDLIRLCIRYRLPYSQIGKLVGLSKVRIFQLYHYGVRGVVNNDIRQAIKKRDGNLCLICRKSGKLHIHHIGNPEENSPSNLVSLCPSCHSRVERTKRRNLTKG